jgi:transposase
MHDMLKRHEIQVLVKAGLEQAEVARIAMVGERTVRRVAMEPPVTSLLATESRAVRPGRPAKAEEYRAFVVELLAEPGKDDLPTLEVLRLARLKGYKGGKSAFYALVKSIRPRETRPMVRFEGLPGEFSQHDFGQVVVTFVDGRKERVRFFASRLKYSRRVEVSLVPDEGVESLTRSLVDHFAAIGGVPLVAVFDRPKTVALRWKANGEVTEWNSTFAYVTLELGVGVEVCWPRRANQKGSIENLVGWVKGSFFKPRRFVDEEDLRQQLSEWIAEVNTKIASRATGVVPSIRFEAEERSRLRPLRLKPEDLALRIPVAVGPTATVVHDTHVYSMPPEAIGLPGTLYLYRDKVRIVAGRFAATHERLREAKATSNLPEHRAEMIAAVSGKRGKRYLMRQHILEVGPEALSYLTEIVHRRSGAWTSDIERLHDLLQRWGKEALRLAFGRAIKEGVYGAEYVAHFVEAAPLFAASRGAVTK